MKRIETNVKYKKPNGISSTYDVYEVDGIKISRDDSESIFSERYRPRIVDDLILPNVLENKILDVIKTGKIPNMMFYSLHGGSGKDSIISVLRNAIPMTMNVVNASVNRGIDEIKKSVIGFATTSSINGTRKVTYLTEAGGMTKVALDSLKSIVEDSSTRVSYMMSTNSLNNISEPLMTRFQVFDMNTIPDAERKDLAMKAFKRLIVILKIEGVQYDVKEVQQFLLSTFPSYRKMMNNLDQMIVNGEFKVVKNASASEVNEIISYINKGKEGYVLCAKKSMKVDVPLFCNFMATYYTKGLLKESSDIVTFIDAVNALQIAISDNRPFLNVSFLVFCGALIAEDIKLNNVGE